MRRIMVIILIVVLFTTSCGKNNDSVKNIKSTNKNEVVTTEEDSETNKHSEYCISEDEYIEQQNFSSLSDRELLTYVENKVYEEVESSLANDEYKIESVQATWISDEYFEELEYNSKENVFFGYKLSDVEKSFKGKKYAFMLDDEGHTGIEELEEIDKDIYNKVFKNIAIGTGVVLVCVTLSIPTGGLASAVFMTAAKTSVSLAASSAVIGGACSGIVKYMQTGDKEEAMNALALTGSEDFKWGAISGALVGAASELSFALKYPKEIRDIIYSDLDKITPQETEKLVEYVYKGKGQVSYLEGQVVPNGTAGSTRPDVIREMAGKIEAIEVKNYNVVSKNSMSSLKNELKRQVADRIENLPSGSTQRIVLQDRGWSDSIKEETIKELQESLSDIYPDIPIEFIGNGLK